MTTFQALGLMIDMFSELKRNDTEAITMLIEEIHGGGYWLDMTRRALLLVE